MVSYYEMIFFLSSATQGLLSIKTGDTSSQFLEYKVFSQIQERIQISYTVEPLYKGHIGTLETVLI